MFSVIPLVIYTYSCLPFYSNIFIITLPYSPSLILQLYKPFPVSFSPLPLVNSFLCSLNNCHSIHSSRCTRYKQGHVLKTSLFYSQHSHGFSVPRACTAESARSWASIQRRVDSVFERTLGPVILQPILPV